MADAPHVLLVEDDPALRIALREFLGHAGFHVTAGATAETDRGIDVIVCDYRLPGGETGTELIRRVRATDGHDIPAIVLTGDVGEKAARDAAALGRAKLLLKPVRMDVLVNEIRGLLGAAK